MFIEIKWIKKCIRSIVFLIVPFVVSSQNLVPNPSFETIIACPPTYGVICNDYAPPWTCGNAGSSDLFNSCGDPNIAGVPANLEGTQFANSGEGYAGFLAKWVQVNRREYLLIPLEQPLSIGIWYDVSFYLSLGEDSGCGIEQIGAYFSETSPYVDNLNPLDVIPQIETNYGFISDQENWTLIYGCYQAHGGEAFLTIGNFHYDDETPLDPDCMGTYSYYYIDDVSVEEGDGPLDFEFDLGGPEFACFSYVIDPGITGYHYLWEDGSNETTLFVDESGIYSLTLTDGCSVGVDSIEVIIGGFTPPVEIGPAELILCAGEEYTISLDPDLSEYQWHDGSNSPEYNITTGGVYAVTLDDGCIASSDMITVSVLQPPDPFSLGEDTNLCVGETISYSFDPSLGDFIWQDNTTNSTYVITAGGEYALTISNMCGAVSDEIIITDHDVPPVELGDDFVTVCTGETLDFEIDPGLGNILWGDGSTSIYYEITSPGLYSLSITNECGTGSDQIEVIYIDAPVFDLGLDIILCPGETIVLDGDGIQGDYEWQDNSSDTEYVVTTSGTYAVTITNECGTGFDSLSVDYATVITPPDLGDDFSLCPGETAVLNAASPGASYLWQDLSTADSLLVGSAGTYFVKVFNTCFSFTDTVVVSVNSNPPQIDLPASLSLCQGQTLTLDAGVSGVTYLWNDASQNPQLNVNTPGTYSLTVTNACGTDMDTVVVLDGGPAPFVELGDTILLCDGDTVVLSPNFTSVDTWLWNDGSALSSFDVTTSGIVSVQVSNGCGTGYDTLLVSLLPAIPSLSLGNDTSLCPGEFFTLSINTPGVNILWPDGSNGPDFLVSDPGAVFASITNSCGQSVDTIQIGALPDIPMLDLGPDQSLCPGEVITLSPGISNVEYAWQDGSTNNTYQSTQEEIIILTISNECGISKDTLEIFESTQGPQVDLGEDIQACEGETVLIVSNISGVNFLWQDGSTNPDYTATQSGTYILSVSNNCGTDADTIQVDISGVTPSPDLGSDTTLCEGTTLALISNAGVTTTILWQDGSSSPTFVVSSPGTFTLSESNRCGDATDTILISYIDAPDPFSLGKDTTLCPGESITLSAPSTVFEILWQDGSDQSSIIADQAITYSLQLSNECGFVSDEIEIDFDTRIPVINLDPSISWCEGDVITLDATQPFVAEYLWSNGSNSPSIQITTPGLYQIDVTSPCTTISQMIDVLPGSDCITSDGIYIPNVFSPNDDNINDVFTMSFGADLEIVSIQGSIFDRWGNLVFGSQTIPFTWDGRFGDKTMMPGVYTYRITCTYLFRGTEKIEVLFGDITLVR